MYKEQATGQPPTVRGYHSFDALAHKCCVVGGRRGGDLLMDKEQFVRVYDAAAKQWLPPVHLPNLPTPRTSHGSLVVSRNQLLICGGTASFKQRLDDTHVLKAESKRMSWSRVRIPPLPTGLRSRQHCIVWLGPGFTAESNLLSATVRPNLPACLPAFVQCCSQAESRNTVLVIDTVMR